MFKKLKKKIASVRKKQSKQIIIKTLIDGREIQSYSLSGKSHMKNEYIPYVNHWDPTDIKEVEEIDLGSLNELHRLVSMMDSGKWVAINLFYKNGSTKPPFMALGRIK